MSHSVLNFSTNQEAAFQKRVANLYLVGFPAVASIFWLLNHERFLNTWIEWTTFGVFYVLTGLSVGLGFHRCFTHQSYKPVRWLKLSMLFFGTLACQGSVVRWIADHRRHHRLTDQEWDTHSPKYFEDRPILNRVYGLFHAHFAWMFDRTTTDYQRYAPDLLRDKEVMFFHQWYFPLTTLSFILPGLLGWLLGGGEHFWSCLLIGGALRTMVFQNVVWSVNSIGHTFGSRDATEDDDSRNNFLLAILTFGEGWHNNHHASPKCALNQWKWYQIDVGGWIILALEKLGIVSKVTKKRLPKKSLQPQYND